MFISSFLFTSKKALKEGRILFCRDKEVLYELAFRNVQEFEDFKRIYDGYLEEVPVANLNRERILAKVDQLDGYLAKLQEIAPKAFQNISRWRRSAPERLLPVSIEVVINICNLFVFGLLLGLPAEELDLFRKLPTGPVS